MDGTVKTRVDEVGIGQPNEEDNSVCRPARRVDKVPPDKSIGLLRLASSETGNEDNEEADKRDDNCDGSVGRLQGEYEYLHPTS